MVTTRRPKRVLELKIEEELVPIPEKPYSTGITEVLRALKVGQSFIIDIEYRNDCYGLAGRVGIKISCRKRDADSIRVWRIA